MEYFDLHYCFVYYINKFEILNILIKLGELIYHVKVTTLDETLF